MGFNPYTGGIESSGSIDWFDVNFITQIDWLFLKDEAFKFTADDWRVTSDEVINYMEWYTEKFSDQAIIESGGKGQYAEGLFADSIDEDRITYLEYKDTGAKCGYVVHEFDAGDSDKLLFEKDQTWWESLWSPPAVEGISYSPIVALDNSIFSLSAEQFADKYYLNKEDCKGSLTEKGIYQWAKDELTAGNHPILFRYANTEYYAVNAAFDNTGSWNLANPTQDGYVAQETVFLGFDMISLTFKSEDNVETVIPVVASPLDIINGVEAPPDITTDIEWEDWLKLFAILLGVLILVLFINPIMSLLGILLKVFKVVLDFAIWAISAPFKLLGLLFGGNKRR